MSATAAPLDYERLFESAPTPLLVVAPPNWTIVAANAERLRLTGARRDEVIGRKLFDAFPDDPSEPQADGVRNLSDSLARVLATREADVMPIQRYAVRDFNGVFVERWWSPVNTPVLGPDGEVALVIHRADEVTELVRMRGEATVKGRLAREQQSIIDRLRSIEARLRASEAFSGGVLAASADCIKVVSLDGVLEYMSDGGMCVMEIDDFSVLQGSCWSDSWPDAERPKVQAAIADARAGGTGRFQGFATTAKGNPRWWDVVVTPIKGAGGVPEKLLSVSRDISGIKAAEEALRMSEERFRLMADMVPQIVWIADRHGKLEFFNRQFAEYTGSSKHPETPWEAAAKFMHPDDGVAVVAAFNLALDTATPFDVEHRIRSASGEYRWFLARAEAHRDPQTQQITRWFGASIDIDDRRSTEEEIRRSNERLEHQVATRTAERNYVWLLTEDMLARADFDGRIAAVNPAWTKVLGWSEQALLTSPYVDIVHPEDVELTACALRTMKETGEPTRFENRILAISGEWKPIGWTVSPEPDRIHFIAVGRDLAQYRARERQLLATQEALRQSQKLEAMGQLTGGVSHDFNNLLTPIIGSLDLLHRKGLGGDRERRLIDGALQSAERAKTLVQRLLAFARRQPLQTGAVDVAALVAGMADLIASTSGPRVRVEIDVEDGLPNADADQNQLEMAILNLAVNARDAMQEGGTLRVTGEARVVGSDHDSNLTPGAYVRLSVADTGSGMDEQTMARAIEPFFSTKGIGKGTGLGLSMVHGLAGQLGGALEIKSRVGLGTEVILWLPITGKRVAGTVSREDDAGPALAGTVLLVDDEELVRMSTADMLADLGFAVVEAESAREALNIVDGGLAFDLLVTDHLMPGMTGAELVRAVRERRPGMLALVISGYAELEGIAPDLSRLVKPFRQSDLALMIAETVGKEMRADLGSDPRPGVSPRS